MSLRHRIPKPTHTRPAFWPWPSGQKLGIVAPDGQEHVLSSDAMLFLWNCLAPTQPTRTWEAEPLLLAAGAESLDDPLLSGALDTLKTYKLAWFSPQWAAWCKRAPLDGNMNTKPPVRDWPHELPLDLANAWWYLAPEPGLRSWTWKQATRLCSQLNEPVLAKLQAAGKANGMVRS